MLRQKSTAVRRKFTSCLRTLQEHDVEGTLPCVKAGRKRSSAFRDGGVTSAPWPSATAGSVVRSSLVASNPIKPQGSWQGQCQRSGKSEGPGTGNNFDD